MEVITKKNFDEQQKILILYWSITSQDINGSPCGRIWPVNVLADHQGVIGRL